MREKTVENHLRKVVKANGGKIFKFTSPGQAGVADDIIFLPTSFWIVETKAPTSNLSPLQEYFKREITAFGYVNYAVLYTKEQVDNWIAHALQTRSISSRCS